MNANQIPVFLRVQVPLTRAYEDDQMLLCDTQCQLVFRLVGNGGEAAAEAEAGIWKNTRERIVARLRVPYRFHPLTDTLELCGNAMADESAFSLSLCSVSGAEHTQLRPHQAQCASLRGEQYLPLHEALCDVWELIKNACMENGVRLQTNNPPPQALNRLYAVHYQGMLTSIYDPLLDEFDPTKTDGVKLQPLTSVVPGTLTLLPPGTPVLNVIGSGGRFSFGRWFGPDKPKTPPPGYVIFATSWKSAWMVVTGLPTANFCACAGVGHVCTPPGPFAYVGGHMLPGMLGFVIRAVTPVFGAAMIFPICRVVNANPNLQFTVPGGVVAMDITNFLL